MGTGSGIREETSLRAIVSVEGEYIICQTLLLPTAEPCYHIADGAMTDPGHLAVLHVIPGESEECAEMLASAADPSLL